LIEEIDFLQGKCDLIQMPSAAKGAEMQVFYCIAA
jgi:hypothetical protein